MGQLLVDDRVFSSPDTGCPPMEWSFRCAAGFALIAIGAAGLLIPPAALADGSLKSPSAAGSMAPSESTGSENSSYSFDEFLTANDAADSWFTARAGALLLHRSANQTHILLSDQATG